MSIKQLVKSKKLKGIKLDKNKFDMKIRIQEQARALSYYFIDSEGKVKKNKDFMETWALSEDFCDFVDMLELMLKIRFNQFNFNRIRFHIV